MIRLSTKRESSIVTVDSFKYSFDMTTWTPLTSLSFSSDLYITGSGTVTISGDPCSIYGDTVITIVNNCFAPTIRVDLSVPEGVDPDDCASVHYYVSGTEVFSSEFLTGTEVQIVVSTSPGYKFSSWSTGSTDSSMTIVATEDVDLIATVVAE